MKVISYQEPSGMKIRNFFTISLKSCHEPHLHGIFSTSLCGAPGRGNRPPVSILIIKGVKKRQRSDKLYLEAFWKEL